MEIVCVAFDPQGELLATGSMDNTAKVWDIEKGAEIYTLTGHGAEIVSLNYNVDGDKILTASFDNTAKVGLEFELDLGPANWKSHPHFGGAHGGAVLFAVRLYVGVLRDGVDCQDLHPVGRGKRQAHRNLQRT
eukprot:TRINITY_DN3165_c0_g1_i15.p1 TRINITY_DN3165_c0_g1~~TRINITY_DN3165_c0_g1_i15.p1  ORF type:complete len:133 (+),score=13.11 TRINITY_DN3165_c0_g1_i15:94-492(+)